MRFLKWLALAVAVAALSACATPSDSGSASAGSSAYPANTPHSHMRDNKQGYAAQAMEHAPAPKPLHDHREWK
jgi:hypothetical protein